METIRELLAVVSEVAPAPSMSWGQWSARLEADWGLAVSAGLTSMKMGLPVTPLM